MEHRLSSIAAKRIKDHMEATGLALKTVADRMDNEPPTVHKMLNGKSAMGTETLRRLAEAIGLNPADLIGLFVPLLGVVSAGDGADEEMPKGTVLSVNSLYPDGTVAYRVSGDSMLDELIADGDYVLVRPQPQASSGEKVVVWVPDVGTVVKLKRKNHYASANRRQPRDPIPAVDGCKEYGVLVGVIRKC